MSSLTNNTFTKQGGPLFFMSMMNVALFGYIALKDNLLDQSGAVEETVKKIVVNLAFFVATVLLINSLQRRSATGSQKMKTMGNVLVHGFIAILLWYFSTTDFKLFCDDEAKSRLFDKNNIQKFATFGFIYLLVWKIMTPLYDLTKNKTNINNKRLNSRKSYGVAGVYTLGAALLLFMKLYKTGDESNPTIFNSGEERPKLAGALEGGGIVAAIMMLVAMIVLTLNDSRNAFNNK